MEGELDGMRRKSREVLQQAVWAERERMTSLQWELDDCRVALQSSEETVQSLQVLRLIAVTHRFQILAYHVTCIELFINPQIAW